MLPATTLLAVIATLTIGYVDGGAQACNSRDPDFQLCVLTGLQRLIPELARGVPSIGAAAVDPLQGLPPMVHNSHSVHTQLDGVSISGLAAVVVNDANVDLASNTIRIQSSIPGHLTATGTHTTDANIMGIKLSGSGPFTVTLANPSLDLTLSGTPTVGPDGQSYLHLTSANARVDVGTPAADIRGFFSQFPPLEAAAAAFSSSAADSVIADMKPSLERWIAAAALERAQAVFSTVPYDALFPGRTPAVLGLYRALPLPVLRYHK